MCEMCISFCLYSSVLLIVRKLFSAQGLREVRKVVPLHSQSREGYAPKAPAEVGVSGSGKKEFFKSLAGMKNFRTFALTSPPEGREMLKTEIIDIKIRQGHCPS